MAETKVIGNRYALQEVIGQGGMGEVFRAVDNQTQQIVAVKSLKPEIVESDPDMVERFEREGDALRKLNHPSIVKILDTIEENGLYYLVMEYVGGGSLSQLLKDNAAIPIERVMEIGLDLADALTRAHRLKIIHRDIKPANVMLSEDGTPRLTDFGVAHMGDRTRMTETGSLIGTYAYLSPEACNAEPLDERADIWSFGIMLYELLAGRRPFNADQPGAVILAIMTKPIPNISEFRPDVPPELISLIMRMLEKDRNQRIQSVRLVGAELEAMLHGREIPTATGMLPKPEESIIFESRFATPTPSSVATLPDEKTIATGDLMPAQPSRRFSLGMMLAALVFILVMGGGIFAVMSSQDSESDSENDQPTVLTVEPVADKQYMVLVADLERIGGEEQDVARFIAENLNQALERDVPFSNVVVRRYEQVITSHEEAMQAADANNAPIIVWGRYSADDIELDVQIGSLTEFPNNKFDRQFLEDTVNIRVRLTNPRQESVAMQVLTLLTTLHAANNEGYRSNIDIVVMDLLEVDSGEEIGSGAVAKFHQGLRVYGNDAELALQYLTDAINLNASNPMYYALRASNYNRLGQIDNARTDLSTIERLNTPDGWIFQEYIRANTMLFSNDFAGAFEVYSRIIDAEPNDWFNWNFRAALYYLAGDYEAAKADYAKALALEPDVNFPYPYLSLIAMREGRIRDVQTYVNTIINEFPDPNFSNRMTEVSYGSAEQNLFGPAIASFVYMVLEQYELSLQEAQKGLAIGDFSELYMAAAVSYCNLGDYEEGLAAIDNAIRLDPEFAMLHAVRASLNIKNNDLPGALQDLQTLQTFDLSSEMETFIALASPPNFEVDCTNFFTYDFPFEDEG